MTEQFTQPLNDEEIKEVKESVAAVAKYHKEQHPEEYPQTITIPRCCWVCDSYEPGAMVEIRCGKGYNTFGHNGCDGCFCSNGKDFQLKKELSGG